MYGRVPAGLGRPSPEYQKGPAPGEMIPRRRALFPWAVETGASGGNGENDEGEWEREETQTQGETRSPAPGTPARAASRVTAAPPGSRSAAAIAGPPRKRLASPGLPAS
jgi:hypothetical protein